MKRLTIAKGIRCWKIEEYMIQSLMFDLLFDEAQDAFYFSFAWNTIALFVLEKVITIHDYGVPLESD